MTTWTKEAAIQRADSNPLLQEMMKKQPAIRAIVDEAKAQQVGKGYIALDVFGRLKKRAERLVGHWAESNEFGDSVHYDTLLQAVEDLLPLEDEESDGPE